ncbi:MAG TPA: lipopolysaccharide heptosyltransferase I [Thermodesulfovibrionales bacterium]|nr:lipopolysaccharide heptosyltransferase I [Thermodesulfovibrionales bacterium]
MPKKPVVKKILIVKPSSLGDVVHSLPFLNAVHECFPDAEVHWVIAKGLEGLLDGHPMITRLIVINKDLWKKISRAGDTVRELRQLYRDLRREHYDLVADLQGLLRSGLITMATHATVRVGFSEAREGSRLFYTMKVKGGRGIHAVDRYMKMAAEIGCPADRIAFPFPPKSSENGRIKTLLDGLGPYAVIVPGARWKTKIWPAENFGRVAAGLRVRSVVIGSSSDRGIADRVVVSSRGRAISLAGETDLPELIALMRTASLVITNDSGPMHIGAALNVPVVAVFGPTSPVQTGPYGKDHIILQANEPCSPCFKRECADMKCMTNITPEKVLEKTEAILRKTGR